MKISLILSAIALMMLSWGASCDKKTASLSDKYEGTWQYIGRSGGYAGLPFREDHSVNFFWGFKNGSYVRVTHGEKKCGSYVVKAGKEHSFIKGPFLLLDGDSTGPAVRWNHDTLILVQPVADGMSSWFARRDTILEDCTTAH